MAELMYKIANEEAPDIRIIRPQISAELANVVALAMAKRVEARYQDGDQFAADLRRVMSDTSGATQPAPLMASSGQAAPAPDSDRTVAFKAPAESGDSFEATVISDLPSPMASSDRYEKTVVVQHEDPAAPGAARQPGSPS